MVTRTEWNAADGVSGFAGFSTDTKPTRVFNGLEVVNGSTFIEMDTGEVFWFDGDSGTWIKSVVGEEAGA